VTDDAKRAGALEADARGPVLDPDVLERVARILRQHATNGAPTSKGAAVNIDPGGPISRVSQRR
jgi:hypothetical protein